MAEPAASGNDRPEGSIWAIAMLTTLSIPIIFYELGSYGLVNQDEGLYHAVARNMVETGNWGRLVFTGEHRVVDTFLNAPLQYWVRAAFIAAFGDSYWTMRLPSALMALLAIFATYRLVSYVANPRAAFVAGVIQLTTFQFVYLHCARTGEIEPFVCLAFTLAAFFFLRATETGRSYVPHHLCLIAMMNLKLPSVAIPLLAELAYFGISPGARQHFRRWLIAGSILPLGLTWHVAQYFSIGAEASWKAFGRMERRAAAPGLEAYISTLLLYAKTLLLGAFPYVLAFPIAILALLTQRTECRDALRMRALVLYPLAVIIFFVFMIPAYPWYMIPAYPFLCAVLAIWLDRLERAEIGGLALGVVAVLLALLLWLRIEPVNPFAERAALVWPELGWRGPERAALVGVPLAAGLLAFAFYWGRRWLGARFAPLLSSSVLVVLIAVAGLRVLSPLQHTRYVSPMEALYRHLTALRAAGEPFEFPIPVLAAGAYRVRFYFGDDFVVASNPRREGVPFWLLGELPRSRAPEGHP